MNNSTTTMFTEKYPCHRAAWVMVYGHLDLEVKDFHKIMKPYFKNMDRQHRLGLISESLEMYKVSQPEWTDHTAVDLVRQIVRSEINELNNTEG